MKSFFLAIAVAIALVPASGLAKDFDLTIQNSYTDSLTGLSVSGGKVKEFKRIPAAGKRTFIVTLPDDKCEANVAVTFANGQYYDAKKFDFCKYNMLNLFFE
jgi:hypothetical protein